MGSITQQTRVEKATGKKVTVYRAYVRRAGVSRSKVFDKRNDAKAWLRQVEAPEALAAANAGSKAGSFAALVETFVLAPPGKGTKYWEPEHLDFWKTELGHLNAAEIRRGVINAAKEKLQSKRAVKNTPKGPKELDATISAATVNRYLASLSSVFNYAQTREIIEEHPMKAGKVAKLPEGNGRTRILNADEEARLMAAAQISDWPMLHLLVRMCMTTAARKSEVLNLRWSDVRLDDSVAILNTTKNGKARALPLVSDVREALREAAKVKPLRSELVFFDPKDPSQPKQIDVVWRKCRLEAGLLKDREDPLDRVYLHSTRHTAVTRMLKGGANLAQAAVVSGHQTLAMLKRYEHLAASDAVEIAERLLAGKK